ncbi:MAG: YetF domain-containing protein [Acidobacteriaceae bacterium]|jgi:uncharacterized membrane protein YcaP (DUF421 family)
MHELTHALSHDMFSMQLPLAEKIVRPVIVYLFLVVFLRIFGKRELAQLNPFDLVVLLSLSNTVQNAMIGDDNSVSGGVVGAFSLLAINWALAWVLYRAPKFTGLLSGHPATLVREGVVDEAEMKKQSLTHEDLVSVLNKNGFNDPEDVQTCVLEPNGTFFVQGKKPSSDEVEREEIMRALAELTAEVKALRGEMGARG